MDRRNFIKWGSFLTVSVATTGALSACGSDGDDANGGNGNNNPPGDGGNGNPPAAVSFAQGVASGDPTDKSIVLWTRVDGANGSDTVKVTVQVSLDNKFSKLLVNEAITADPAWDYTLRHKVTGLNAATTYYYRFVMGNTNSTVGRTKTAPANGADVKQLKFAFISCQDWNANHWAAFDEMLKEDLDFVVHLGDYIYESLPATVRKGQTEKAHAPLALPNGTKLDDGSTYATTVADYRALYKGYRADPRLQALHARFPMIAIWDDHEFSDDAWQDHQTYTANDDKTEQVARRRSANQAWFEFMPADVTLDLKNPSFENIQIYRSFTFGSLATLVMTDERLYRADHIIPESVAGSFIGSRYLVPKDTLAAAEGQKIAAASGALTPVSMLGDTQRGWWQDQMLASKTVWRLWGNEVSLLRMQVDVVSMVAKNMIEALIAGLGAEGDDAETLRQLTPVLIMDLQAADLSGPVPKTDYPITAQLLVAKSKGAVTPAIFTALVKPAFDALLPPSAFMKTVILDADQWDGYNAERKSMMNFLKSNAIGNVVALTGDIHAFFAGPVMDDYDAAKPAPVMVDLVTAGISSSSLFRFYVDQVHAVPALASLAPAIYQNVTNKLNGTLSGNNSWLKYVETDAQGYAVVTLTADKLTCDFRKMKPLDDNGEVPASPAIDSTFTVTVNAGMPAVVLPAA